MKALKCKASAPLASGGPLAHAHGLEVMRYITGPSDKRTCTSHATKLKKKSEWLLCSVTCFTGAIAQSTSW